MTDLNPSKTGMGIRSQHPYAYRSGEWARIIGTTTICAHQNLSRGCYQLQWPDGATDDWAIEDPDAEYEFREMPRKDTP